MSTATRVPETHGLDGDDARKTLRRTGWGRLAKDSVQRFRTADGFSHTRAVAPQITFTYLWVPKSSSTSCDLGIFVDEPAQAIDS